jgi:DNA-binding transcriptional MerR regulator
LTPKLYKAGEVCDLVQVQQYVLRSWEKEFPGIGIQHSPDGPRLYRQSDLEHVQRIKQLVFGEGLTVAGVRRRLDETRPAVSAVSASEAAEVLDTLGRDARSRIALVRDGLREIQSLLTGVPGSSNGARRRLTSAAPTPARAKTRPAAARSKIVTRSKVVKRRVVAKTVSTRKKPQTKRKRL